MDQKEKAKAIGHTEIETEDLAIDGAVIVPKFDETPANLKNNTQ